MWEIPHKKLTSTRKTNAEPRCFTLLGGHDGAIWAAKHLKLVHIYHLANPYTDLTNSLWGTKYFLWETNAVFQDTINSLRGTKYSLWETNTMFQDTTNSLREPLEKQMISGMGTETLVMRRWSIQLSMVTFT